MDIQTKQPYPQLDAKFLTPQGTVAPVWQRLLTGLWQKLGGIASEIAAAVYLQQNTKTLNVEAYQSQTGELLGTVQLINTVGGAPVVVPTGASPLEYAPGKAGNLIVFGAHVEISRDGGGTWHKVTEMGGSIPLLQNDRAKLVWYDKAPPVTFFPNN